ncbi:MAG: hypothetical protein PHT50_02650 [Candidatus Omnitrophica bacterium]|nr:hypothetical protein [Candidatus Omnitrophota bacterium]
MLAFISMPLSGSFASSVGQKPDERNVPNVILIILGGVRNSESIDDPTHQYIPHLYGEMFKEGTLYNNLLANDFEYHMPAIYAMLTGKHHNHYPGVVAPTLFQYARKKYEFSSKKAVSIGLWEDTDSIYISDKFGTDTYPGQVSIMSSTYSPEMKQILTTAELTYFDTMRNFMGTALFCEPFAYLHWDTLQEIIYPIFNRAIQEFKPKLALFNVPGVDCAHYSAFGRYILALKRSDEMIYRIWKIIQEDPFYKDNTYLIICPDHGRNLYYMEHSENCRDNPSSVWVYIYGPKIKKGVILNRPVYHVDIFATVDYIMNLEVSPQEGKILKDCFR